METLYCAYCLEPFERPERQNSWSWSGPVTQTCGAALCRARTSSWNSWLRSTRLQTIRGDVNKAPRRATRVPPMSAKHAALFDLVHRPEIELEEAA